MNLFLGIGGAVLLLIGSFCPVISLPIVGGISYVSAIVNHAQNGTMNDIGISAILALVACVAAFAILCVRQFSWLWGPATGATLAVGIILYDFIMLQAAIARDLPNEADNPFAGLARAAAQAVRPDFGLAIIMVAVGLLIASAVTPKKRLSRSR